MTDKCLMCGTLRYGKWALLFSAPGSNSNSVNKHHICPDCYRKIMEGIKL